MQHNTQSGNNSYKMKHPSIQHEYLLIFEKSAKTIVQVAWDQAVLLKKEIAQTWRSLVRIVMMQLGEAGLPIIYQIARKTSSFRAEI